MAAAAELRARFEEWDNEHNACTIDGECDAIEALWNIAREAVEALERIDDRAWARWRRRVHFDAKMRRMLRRKAGVS